MEALGSHPTCARCWLCSLGVVTPVSEPQSPCASQLGRIYQHCNVIYQHLSVSLSVHCWSYWALLKADGWVSAQHQHIVGAQEIYVEWRSLYFSPGKWKF